MTPVHVQQKEPLPKNVRMVDLLFLALTAGAIVGFLEGAGSFAAQAGRWLSHDLMGTTAEPCVLYFTPLFAMLLFGVVALLLVPFLQAVRAAPETRARVLILTLSFLAYFDWIWLSQFFRNYAAVILAAGLASATERLLRPRLPRVLQISPKLFAASLVYICVTAAVVNGFTWRQETKMQAALPPARAGAPNVVWIILDTVRADHMSLYGYGRKTTPYLESLAAAGTTFDNAVAASSWTFPSHVSMLTGQYPREHGAQLSGYDGRYATVASSFDRMGYITGGFSGNMDWFAAGRGMAGGFQHFEDGYWSAASAFAQTGFGQLANVALDWVTSSRVVPGYKRARDVNQTALRWLDAAPKRPFFLVLNYYDANAGGAVPEQPYRGMFTSTPLPPPAKTESEFDARRLDKARSDQYDGSLVYLDNCVREIVDALSKRTPAGNLLVVVTADHGELMGEHDLSGHRNALYWELLHVPLIFEGSPALPRGVRIEQPVSLVSLPATLLELVGEKDARGFPAPSLSRLWNASGAAPTWPFPISELAQMHYPGLEKLPNYTGSLSAIVTPHWLLIEHSAHGPALYNWRHDPENLHDLRGAPGTESLAGDLNGCLQAQNVELRGAQCPVDAAPPLEDQNSLKPNEISAKP